VPVPPDVGVRVMLTLLYVVRRGKPEELYPLALRFEPFTTKMPPSATPGV
jgi:hypothetical protein